MDEEPVQDRLLDEVRSLHTLLDSVRYALLAYPDLERLSLIGAVQFLIRRVRAYDDIKFLVKRAVRNPQDSNKILIEVEKLLDKT